MISQYSVFRVDARIDFAHAAVRAGATRRHSLNCRIQLGRGKTSLSHYWVQRLKVQLMQKFPAFLVEPDAGRAPCIASGHGINPEMQGVREINGAQNEIFFFHGRPRGRMIVHHARRAEGNRVPIHVRQSASDKRSTEGPA